MLRPSPLRSGSAMSSNEANMGFSYQKGRFVSDHLDDVAEAQQAWLTQTWPEIVNLAKKKGAMILFGDEASFAQWGCPSP